MCLACEMDAWWLPAIEAAREAKSSRDTADLTLVPFAAASTPDVAAPAADHAAGDASSGSLSVGWLFEPVAPLPAAKKERQAPERPNPFRCEEPGSR
jgi:hypothetical protein